VQWIIKSTTTSIYARTSLLSKLATHSKLTRFVKLIKYLAVWEQASLLSCRMCWYQISIDAFSCSLISVVGKNITKKEKSFKQGGVIVQLVS